ncbi:MAG: hypothetical protein WD824_08345 [Cyclobacteriaceae bacterium]
MLMLKMIEKGIEKIAVSDPTHKLDTLQLKITAPIEGSGAQWTSTWDKNEKISVLDIALPKEGYAGQSVVLDLPIPR